MEELVVEKGKDAEENSGDRRHLLESEETLESKESSSARSSEKSTDESSGDEGANGNTEISDMKNINTSPIIDNEAIPSQRRLFTFTTATSLPQSPFEISAKNI